MQAGCLSEPNLSYGLSADGGIWFFSVVTLVSNQIRGLTVVFGVTEATVAA